MWTFFRYFNRSSISDAFLSVSDEVWDGVYILITYALKISNTISYDVNSWHYSQI